MISIYYNNRPALQGVVLAYGDRRVRVAVKDSDDAVEFRLINQAWVSEDLEIVKMDVSERIAQGETGEGDTLETLFRVERQPESMRRVM